MKLINNYKYWILNLLGWILYVIFTLSLDKISYSLPYIEETSRRVEYFLVEGILCGILGFALSFIILYFIEYYMNVGKFIRKDIQRLVVVFMIVQVVYAWLLWPMLDIATNHYSGSFVSEKLTFFMKLTNVPFFAVAFLVWVFIVLSLKVFHYINNIKLQQAELQTSLKESQLNTLKGQINPHFMFNSLNNIRGLMLEDVSKARKILTHLSETLSYSLTKSNVDSIALEDELEMVESYVAIAKIQFDKRLIFETHIDEDALTKQIPQAWYFKPQKRRKNCFNVNRYR